MRRSTFLAAIAASMLLGAVLPAWAHAVLIDSRPAVNAAIDPGQAAIMLHYNSRIDAGRSVVTLTDPDHAQTRLPIQAGGTPDTLRGQTTALTPGAYTLRWQVLATDGHITRGDVPFSVRSAAP